MASRPRSTTDATPQGPVRPTPVLIDRDATARLPSTSTLPGRVRPNPVPAPVITPAPPPESSVPLWMLGLAIFAGAVLALVTIPLWVPTLGASLMGADPKASWYLSRASALVAFVLLWVSMVSGLFITNKMARIWPGVFTAFDLHQFTSLLGLGFAVFHALVLVLNHYITYSLVQLIVPFAGTDYRPIWVGLGQVALYLSVLVSFTFYVCKQIGNRAWHVIHLLSYLLFALALLHGVFSGTDSNNLLITGMYWAAGLSLLGLTVHRFLQQQPRGVRQS